MHINWRSNIFFQGTERAQLFVHDFVLTQLIGKTLDSMWTISNPMGLLAGIVAKQGMAEPESRSVLHNETDRRSAWVILYRSEVCLCDLVQIRSLPVWSCTDHRSVCVILYRTQVCLGDLVQIRSLPVWSCTDHRSVCVILYRTQVCLCDLVQIRSLSVWSCTDQKSVCVILYRSQVCLCDLVQNTGLSVWSCTDQRSACVILYRWEVCLCDLVQLHFCYIQIQRSSRLEVIKAVFYDGNHVAWYIVIFNGPSSPNTLTYIHTCTVTHHNFHSVITTHRLPNFGDWSKGIITEHTCCV